MHERPLQPAGGAGLKGGLQVAIVGGGPLGLALALMLARAGIGCEVIEAQPAGAANRDSRVLALSHGSRQTLERLGAWAGVGATPIAAIHVSQQYRLGRTLMRAQEIGLPALGYVVEAGTLRAALAGACEAAEVTLRHGWRATLAEADARRARLLCATAQGEQAVEAQLLAWAEGAVSAEEKTVRDYGQQAIVAGVRCRHPHGGLAYERFARGGPVALLPRGEGYALVWTVPEKMAAELLALDARDFLSQLHDIFAGRLDFIDVGERASFPLALRVRKSSAAGRAIWLGNAAQTLHPVAGQGFNLALRDAAQLARLMQEDSSDCGNPALLAHHVAERRRDRDAAVVFTDGLIRLFGLRSPLAGHARGAGLLALDLLPAARRFVMRRMIYGIRK